MLSLTLTLTLTLTVTLALTCVGFQMLSSPLYWSVIFASAMNFFRSAWGGGGEMWARYGRDVGEVGTRCGRDMGEISAPGGMGETCGDGRETWGRGGDMGPPAHRRPMTPS